MSTKDHQKFLYYHPKHVPNVKMQRDSLSSSIGHAAIQRIKGFQVPSVSQPSNGKLVHFASGTINMDAGKNVDPLPLMGSLLPFGLSGTKTCDGLNVKTFKLPIYRRIN